MTSTTRASIASADLKEYALDQGADCVGVAVASAIPESVPARPAEDLLAGSQSVIVFGIVMINGSIGSPSDRIATYHTDALYDELRTLGYKLARRLERAGYRAANVPTHLPVEMSNETKGMVGELSLKHAAVAAGLGQRGLNGVIITPQWGPRVRWGAVITDAILQPDRPTAENPCTECLDCVNACPAGALSADGTVDTAKCLVKSQKYGLPHYIRFLEKLLSADEAQRKAMLRDPFFWSLHQAAGMGLYYSCFACLTSCPVGR